MDDASVWATWLSAVVAMLALTVAFFSFREARVSREQSERLTELERTQREARAARQIDVYWGHDRVAPGQPDSFAVVIHNRGDEAVYDFRAETEALPEHRALPVAVVPPGWWRARHHPQDPAKPLGFGYVKPVDSTRFSLAGDNAHKILEFSFVDAVGVRWRAQGGGPPERVT